jgi:hypothetical protein
MHPSSSERVDPAPSSRLRETDHSGRRGCGKGPWSSMCRRPRRQGCSAEVQTFWRSRRPSKCTRTVLPLSDCGGLAPRKRSVTRRTSHAGSPARRSTRRTPAQPRLPSVVNLHWCAGNRCSMGTDWRGGMQSRHVSVNVGGSNSSGGVDLASWSKAVFLSRFTDP